MAERLLTIGQLAAQTGLRTSALRYYEDEGLLAPVTRVGGQRRYRSEAIEQLTVIGFCRELGFSLGEIRQLLQEPRGAAQRRSWRGLVDAKLAELAAAAARAETMRAILATSRDCDCIDLAECAARCRAVTVE
jgi:MerR family redox-sensitive transcriptional activator SoxR